MNYKTLSILVNDISDGNNECHYFKNNFIEYCNTQKNSSIHSYIYSITMDANRLLFVESQEFLYVLDERIER